MRALRLAWAIYMLKRAWRKREAAWRAMAAAERAVAACMPDLGWLPSQGAGAGALPSNLVRAPTPGSNIGAGAGPNVAGMGDPTTCKLVGPSPLVSSIQVGARLKGVAVPIPVSE